MTGENNLDKLIAGLSPKLNTGEYVFVSVENTDNIPRGLAVCEFREAEGTTLIIDKSQADKLHLTYDYIAAWITLEIHSSLAAVGLTACFVGELAKHDISCNVVAGYYHDHIFVDVNDADNAISALNNLAKQSNEH